MGVCEYGPGVLFVHQGDVFFALGELVSARRTLRRVFALVFMLSVCEVNLIFLSYVTPSVVAVSV